MGIRLFKNFIKKAILERQPGPPPRQGLQWKPTTHRWIRPKEQVSPEQVSSVGGGRLQLATHFMEQEKGIRQEVEKLNKKNIPIGQDAIDGLMRTLADIEQGKKHAFGKLYDIVHDITNDRRMNEYNSPMLTDLANAVMAWDETERDSGLSESSIVGGDVDQDGPERDDSSDYWADFDINEHKDGIKNYLDEVWTDYNHLSPDKIQSEILMPLIEDLDIVLPDDDEGMDNARESLEGYLGEAIQNKWLSSMGRTGRQLGRMGESERKRR